MAWRTCAPICAALAAQIACGRLDFAAQPDAPPVSPTLIAFGEVSVGAQLTATAPAQMAGAGQADAVVVGITISSNSTVVLGVTDADDDTYISAQLAGPLSGARSEIWYAPVQGAPSSVTVQVSGAGGFDVWFLAFSGVAPAIIDQSNESCMLEPAVAVANVTTTRSYQPVFGVAMVSLEFVSDVAAPFLALDFQRGNGAAYYIAPEPGTYGPTWTAAGIGGAGICSSTVSLLPE